MSGESTYKLKDNFKHGTFKQITPSWLNWMARSWNNITVKPAGRFLREPSGYRTVLDLTDLVDLLEKKYSSFLLAIVDNTHVAVYQGYGWYDTTATLINTNASIAVTESGYIYVAYNTSSATWSEILFSTDDPESLGSDTYKVFILWYIECADGIINDVVDRRTDVRVPTGTGSVYNGPFAVSYSDDGSTVVNSGYYIAYGSSTSTIAGTEIDTSSSLDHIIYFKFEYLTNTASICTDGGTFLYSSMDYFVHPIAYISPVDPYPITQLQYGAINVPFRDYIEYAYDLTIVDCTWTLLRKRALVPMEDTTTTNVTANSDMLCDCCSEFMTGVAGPLGEDVTFNLLA